VRVINSIQPGIDTFTVSNAAEFYTAIGGGCQYPTLNVRERFLNAFGVTNTTDPSQNVSTMIRFTLSAIPSGITLEFPPTVGLNWARALADGTLEPTYKTLPDGLGTTAIYYRVTMDTDPTVIDTLSVPVDICGEPPITIGSVTAVATFAPVSTLAFPFIPVTSAIRLGQ
jgi:hypothetical protein